MQLGNNGKFFLEWNFDDFLMKFMKIAKIYAESPH